MIITYLGKSLIKIQSGDMVIALNPYIKDGDKKGPKFGADIVLLSRQDDEYGAVDNMTYGNKIPFVADGPGEYDVSDIHIQGVLTNAEGRASKEYPLNTAFMVFVDGMRVCHLGALRDPHLDTSTKETLGEIDVLFVPVGGDGVIDAKEAHKIVTALEPKIIIPVSFNGASDKQLEIFLKELGEESQKREPKVVLKKKDIDEKEGEVLVLEAQ